MGFMNPGNVVWFEISTADAAAPKDFYGQLLGWSFAVDPDSSVGGVTYTRIMAPGKPFPMGAIYQDEGDASELINVSIVSADVAADQARLEKLGASMVVPATEVGDVTTFARLADPHGNVFSIFQNNQAPERLAEFAEQAQEQMAEMMGKPAPGSYAWFEIGTTDPRPARTSTAGHSAGRSSSTTRPAAASSTTTSSPGTSGPQAACTTSARTAPAT
jgi:predicted enzyme related to lactoylglutathione lyase